MVLAPLIQEVIRRFRDKLSACCEGHVLEVRVFGSMARGDAHEDSDLDLFVMVDDADLELKDRIHRAAWDIEYEMELPFSVSTLVMPKEQFEELRRRERRIALDILSEGVIVS